MSDPPTKKQLKVGLIGPGSIARERLIPALRAIEGASFWSVLGRDLGRTKEFATTLGAAAPEPAYTDISAFLADTALDAVIVASPDKLHAEQCLAAAKAAKHVFVEKPMATNHADALAIVDACAKANVRLAVGYHLRFHQGHILVKEMLNAGRIGQIRHVNISWTMISKPDWRATSDLGRWWSLAALGTHSLDLVRWFVESEIKQSYALTSSPVYGGPHDETSVVSIGFQSGATAQILSSVIMRAPRLIEIFGSEGSIRCVDTLGPRGAGQILLNGEEQAFQVADPYKAELTDFCNAITGGAAPSSEGSNGAANVALLDQLSNQ